MAKIKTQTRSKYETQVLEGLIKNLLGFGVNIQYEGARIPYVVPNKVYIPDFILTGPYGKKMYIEAKGWFKPSDRAKMKRVRDQHPELDIRFMFQRATNKLGPHRSWDYVYWCERENFKWCENELPTEWVRELMK